VYPYLVVQGYLKIVISFYQILSTFPITFFQLDWSSSNDDVMENSKWSRVEIFSIPDFSCILQVQPCLQRPPVSLPPNNVVTPLPPRSARRRISGR
jgi:hypothetical protein